ncbi:MAG TPA: GntR family transcriptional regulator [Pyrinomonadaceae bacterium]|nr:GntR family transcriptional regulator [Pyrinomonadaceae bacterium]
MLFVLEKGRKGSLLEQARSQLLTALHTGRLAAGDRLPSVRQVAQRNGINLKTAFFIYQRLAAEGYVTLRVGSGAYVSDIAQSDLEEAYCHTMLRMIRSNLAEAERFRVGPREYLKLVQRLVNRPAAGAARVAVVECNEEQINLFAHEISSKTGLAVSPVLLGRLEARDARAARELARADYLATTHFHFREVKALTAGRGKPLVQLRLNPAFVPSLVEAARRGPLLMVVSNADYFPAFRQSLLRIGTPRAVVERIAAVDHSNPRTVRAAAERARAVYVSPICKPRIRGLIPAGVESLQVDGTLSDESLERLEAVALFGPRG